MLWNCEQDEVIEKPTELATIFSKQLKASVFKEVLPYGFSVDWSDPEKEYSSQLDSYFYEFPVYFENKEFNPDVVNKITKRNYYKKYKVVVLENEEGNYSYHLASYFIDKRQNTPNLLKKEVSLNQDYSYKGILHLYNTALEKVFSKRITINKQQIVDFTVNLNPTKSNTKDQARSNCRTITTYHYRDYYRNVYDMHGNYLGTQYMYTVLVGTSTRTECDERIDPDYIDSEVTCVGDCTAIVSDGLLCPNGDPADANGNCPGYGDDLNVNGSPTPEQLLKIQQDYLANELSLTRGSAEMEWVYNNANNVQITLLYNFIEIQGIVGTISLDSINFALQAILAWIRTNNTAAVNFDDRIINELTGKAKCVYNKLKGQSNTLFNSIINNHFGSSKTANIKFSIGNISSGEDALTYTTYDSNPNNTVVNNGDMRVVLGADFISNASNIEIALALIHESIHAELLNRCIKLGLVKSINYSTTNGAQVIFNNDPHVYGFSNKMFAKAVSLYTSFTGSQWNHNLFNIEGYRSKLVQNLLDIHHLLNDPSNDFLNNINNIPGGQTYTLEQVMNYIAWIGLEETLEYKNIIDSNVVEKNKKEYIETAARNKYNKNCNE